MSSSRQSGYVRSVSDLDNTNVNTNTGTWAERLRPSKRKLIQLYSALLYNAHLRGFITGEIYQGKAKAVCVPGFNCYSCPGAAGACPLGSIQNALAWSGHRAGWYVLGIIMIFGLSLGRTICGWLCPMGLLQELLHMIPTPKMKKSSVTRALSYLKYIILAVFAAAIPMWYGVAHDLAVPGFCKYICPAGTFEGAIGLLSNPNNTGYFSMLKILFTRKFVIMLIIGLACVFCYRSFCRFICPLGAIYGLFNRLALVSVKVDENRCNSCGACVRSCRMDVRHVGDHECINCAKCMSSCSQNALSLKAGTYTILAPAGGCADDGPDSEKKRLLHGRIARGAALALLCFALVWFNFLDPSVKEEGAQTAAAKAAAEEDPYASTAPVGTAVGEQMADFTVDLIDGSSFHLADQRGKVVIINMWATYCGPCVQELPGFQDFLQT
ncbi:MAG: 4Fe-4S binding protein, partial [Oscillospiraceae bacterium]|nr:4Fe-4S binding protein [Oscillospiraceae bacterium]